MTAPVYDRWGVTVYEGDCLDVLRQFPDGHFAAVVTDPPYNLSFMGREWDAHESPLAFQRWCEQWARECLRVLKPGGMMLSFGGTRTFHRLTCGIEDAGFEIRDGIDWLYAGGMPKGINISKAIDRMRDDRDDVNKVTAWLAQQRDKAGLTNQQIDEAFSFHGMAGHWTAAPHLKIAQCPRWDQWLKLRELIGFGDDMDAEVWRLNGRKGTPGEAWNQREVIGRAVDGAGNGSVIGLGSAPTMDSEYNVTTSATNEARQWEGWNTQLRPSHEPIIVARKPFPGTVAGNVLAHGTGGINVDACRVGDDTSRGDRYGGKSPGGGHGDIFPLRKDQVWEVKPGRYPPNVVLSHVPSVDPATGEVVGDACADGCVDGCPVRELDQQSGVRTSGAWNGHRNNPKFGDVYNALEGREETPRTGDSGGASRFFPCFRFEAKAPTAERPRVAGESHSTVKPLSLIRWLVRLCTPPGGIVLDCFAGTGVTGQAARAEGFQAVLIDSDPAAIPWIVARLDAHPREDKPTTAQPAARQAHPDLFEGEAQ